MHFPTLKDETIAFDLKYTQSMKITLKMSSLVRKINFVI